MLEGMLIKQTRGFYMELHDDTADEFSLVEDAMVLNAT